MGAKIKNGLFNFDQNPKFDTRSLNGILWTGNLQYESGVKMVRVEVRSEVGTSREPAKVLVYSNEWLVAEVIAEVELKQGADSGWYHCVTLKKQ